MLSFGLNLPLPLNGTWQGTVDETISGGLGFFSQTWTFNGPGEVQVTDIYVTGDMYNVYDNNVLLGSSSTVPSAPLFGTYTSNPSVGWGNPDYSHFSYILGAGSHSITIELIQLPDGYNDGTYSIRGLATPDSGPGVIGLLGIVTVLIVGARARRLGMA